jgi:hypothetical protein
MDWYYNMKDESKDEDFNTMDEHYKMRDKF